MATVGDGDLDAARRYVPDASEEALTAFASRQLEARRRLTRLIDFYAENPCRMARIHLLTACAVTLGRFCGFSPAFDAIGEALMPVDGEGSTRTGAWRDYELSREKRRPVQLRDELWMIAHVADMEAVRARGLDRDFYREAQKRPDDPTWLLLRQHMEMTLGARLLDHSALSGAIPYETAMAQGMSTALGRILRAGWRLLGRYAWEATRALTGASRETRAGLVSYRRTALLLILYSTYAWTASPVYRRGIRTKDRGRTAEGDAWPLLAEVLGRDRVQSVDPAIVDFYSNPSRFTVRAKLELHTIPARFWSWAATLLIGQGLYETHHGEFDATFRVFRRDDGSMHFVRELFLGETLRIFDSDFVVEHATLYEVFVDHRIAIRMAVDASPVGGLLIRAEEVRWRGLRLPRFGLRVEFRSQVREDELHIDGHLLMQPSSALGRFVAHGLLRRPQELGAIHYRIRRPE